MSYENAPATKMLAVNCAICRKPLVDAVSVETGVGPLCRKRHGFNLPDAPPQWEALALLIANTMRFPDTGIKAFDARDARVLNNVLVHHAAMTNSRSEVVAYAKMIAATGFTKLATVLAKRRAKTGVIVTVKELNGRILVDAPYTESGLASVRHVPSRLWDKDAKVNTFAVDQRRAVWEWIKANYKGYTLIAVQGHKVIV